jgi:hypothetical protein
MINPPIIKILVKGKCMILEINPRKRTDEPNQKNKL